MKTLINAFTTSHHYSTAISLNILSHYKLISNHGQHLIIPRLKNHLLSIDSILFYDKVDGYASDVAVVVVGERKSQPADESPWGTYVHLSPYLNFYYEIYKAALDTNNGLVDIVQEAICARAKKLQTTAEHPLHEWFVKTLVKGVTA